MNCKTVNMGNYNFNIREKLQHFVGVFLFVATTLILTSCTANKYSQLDIDKYLTKERVKAKTSPISFRIPKGWYVVNANDEAFIDLWILRNDMEVSLSLQPVHSNSSSFTIVDSYEASKLLRETKFKNKIHIVDEKPLQLNNSEVLFYNYKVDEKKFRVALFQNNNNFYELTLFGNNRNIEIEYFIQELVISSAK